MESRHEFEEHYVAFIDILGFKELLTTGATCEDIYSIFKCLKENSRSSLFYNGEDVSAFDHVNHYIMSDSIVLYIKSDIDEAFLALLGTCIHLQESLIYRDNPILLRGGIAKGPLFVEGSIIYGKGLSDAYQIENAISIYPRIAFNKELLNYAKNNNQSSKRPYWEGFLTYKDEDELFFAHYLAMLYVHNIEDVPQLWNNLLKLCQSILDSSYNKSIREKYLWLKNYILKEANLQKSMICGLPGGKDFLIHCGIYDNNTQVKSKHS